MEVKTALRLIDNVVYKPGWKFTAEDHTKRFEGTIRVRVDYHAPETGRENAEQGYPEEIDTYAEFPIMVADITSDVCLYRRLLDAILRIEQHEAREALRVEPTFWAPFHPHAVGGMKAWAASHNLAQPAELEADLSFGIV